MKKQYKKNEEQTPALPPGAQAIQGFQSDLETALSNLNTALGMVEHPQVLTAFEQIGQAVGEQVEALKQCYKEAYGSEEEGKPADKEPDGDEQPTEKEDEPKEDEEKPQEKADEPPADDDKDEEVVDKSDDGDEDDEETAKAIKSLQAELQEARKALRRVTGKVE